MSRRRREAKEQEELKIKQLSDEEVVAHLNNFVEAWEQREDAEGEIRVFNSNTGEPGVVAHQFDSTEDFMTFNQRRREYLQKREDLYRQRDSIAERLQESANVIKVLLPDRCSLVHNHGGFRYVIEDRNGEIVMQSKTSLGQQA